VYDILYDILYACQSRTSPPPVGELGSRTVRRLVGRFIQTSHAEATHSRFPRVGPAQRDSVRQSSRPQAGAARVRHCGQGIEEAVLYHWPSRKCSPGSTSSCRSHEGARWCRRGCSSALQSEPDEGRQVDVAVRRTECPRRTLAMVCGRHWLTSRLETRPAAHSREPSGSYDRRIRRPEAVLRGMLPSSSVVRPTPTLRPFISVGTSRPRANGSPCTPPPLRIRPHRVLDCLRLWSLARY
jgi:hypothetical protein